MYDEYHEEMIRKENASLEKHYSWQKPIECGFIDKVMKNTEKQQCECHNYCGDDNRVKDGTHKCSVPRDFPEKECKVDKND